MTHLRQRMIEDMQLRGLSEKTQEAYVRAVRQLTKHCGKSPGHISEEELRRYFLFLENDRQVSPSTFAQALHGIKFFYEHTLKKEWSIFGLVRPRREKKLPVVLSVAEVHRILGCLYHLTDLCCFLPREDGWRVVRKHFRWSPFRDLIEFNTS